MGGFEAHDGPVSGELIAIKFYNIGKIKKRRANRVRFCKFRIDWINFSFYVYFLGPIVQYFLIHVNWLKSKKQQSATAFVFVYGC